MSELQIALMIIGAIIILAVMVFNWWQERKFNQQVERSFSDVQGDVLLDDAASADADSKEDIGFIEDNFSMNASQVLTETDNSLNDDRFLRLDQDVEINRAEEDLDKVFTDVVNYQHKHELKHEHNALPDNIDATPEMLDEVALETQQGNIVPINTQQSEEIKSIFNEAFSQTRTAKPKELNQPDNLNAHPDAVWGVESDVKLNTGTSTEDSMHSLPAMLHTQMDLTALLYLASEKTIAQVAKHVSGLFEEYNKPLHIHLLNENEQWLLLASVVSDVSLAEQKVSRIACSLQLADRGGAVSRSVLNRFQLAVETLGLDVNAHVEWQSHGDAIATATELDAFCIDVDKTMGFHLVHGESGAFTGTKLRGLAEAQGMRLDADGTFKFYDEYATKLLQSNPTSKPPAAFTMFNRDQHPFSNEMLRTSVVKGITFQLDIPHVKHCTEAFNQMVQTAKQMAIGLNAVLVDDNNRPLGDMQIEMIRHQLKVIHAKLLVRGIMPGSDSALRLFS
ncbi:MAG: cell division protein ZipA C-terminal FtsZ-binding domain-containing protein [Methylotenera sp.]|nr:cell division protein ZipA C-terminal FtsZ-binding domain-containing protein [Methylotenera sp.]